SRRRHTRFSRDWSSDVCSSDLNEQRHGRAYRASEAFFNWVLGGYERSLAVVLRHPQLMLVVTLGTIALSVYLYIAVPKGFFPQRSEERRVGKEWRSRLTADVSK